MESSRQPDSILPATVVLIALLVGGYLGFQPALNSSRPDGLDIQGAGTPEVGKVRARLWEDPFAAVQRIGKTNQISEIPIALKSPQGQLMVLFVMVPGGPYHEEGEQRLRTRYAVLSALDLAGYYPSDDRHISYTRVKVPLAPAKAQKRNKHDILVPFEWFNSEKRSEKKDSPSVLVLWLEDESFSTETLRKLGELKKQLASLWEPAAAAKAQFALVGPTNSTVFGDMVREGLVTICSTLKQNGRALGKADVNSLSLPIYSPWATIDDQKLIDDLKTKGDLKLCIDRLGRGSHGQ